MLPELRIYTTRNDVKYLLVEHEEVISDHIRRDGVWGSHYIDLCDQILRNSEFGRVVDVGASIGTWTVPLAIMHDGRHVFESFEPLPKINMQLSTNVLLNNLDNVNVYKYVISNKEEVLRAPALDFDRSANHGAYSFNKKYDSYRGIVHTNKEDIYEVRTLDSFRFADVRLVKVTTPAMESDVFAGMYETLELSNWPPVLFESWTTDWYKEDRAKAMDFFAARGYEHYQIIGNDHVLAFKTKAQADFLLNEKSSIEKPATTTNSGFTVAVQEHDREDVLKHQVGATSV